MLDQIWISFPHRRRGMKPGDAFDPVDVNRRLKLYPVDTVDARTNISDGPKRLYAQLFKIAVTIDRRKNPWPGFIFVKENFLAKRLGKSESGIRRDSSTLRKLGLVRVERPSRTKSNRYYFLWQPEFDRPDVSYQESESAQDDRADVSGRDRAYMSAQIRNERPDLSGHDSASVGGRYKEEQNNRANTEGRSDGSQVTSLQIPEGARAMKNQNPPSGFALDEQLPDFMAACRDWGMNLVEPDDFYEAFRFEWGRLDFFQRRDAIAAIRARIAAGIDPMGWKPKNFLKSEWKRAVKVLEPRRRAATAPDDYSYQLPQELAQ
jgi:hypothetical protein